MSSLNKEQFITAETEVPNSTLMLPQMPFAIKDSDSEKEIKDLTILPLIILTKDKRDISDNLKIESIKIKKKTISRIIN